jgi:hypothetical protein
MKMKMPFMDYLADIGIIYLIMQSINDIIPGAFRKEK